MEDKLHNYFKQNDFDILEPNSNHFHRFERKLQAQGNSVKPKRKFSWAWMSVAAAVILFIGFGLGNLSQNNSNSYNLAAISPKMGEAQNFFVNAIQTEIIELEKNRSLDTEKIIESALDQLEELEDAYKTFLKELKNAANQTAIINAMIGNYQQRLEILQDALHQIEQLKIRKNLEDEIYI